MIRDDIHAVVEQKVGPNATIYLGHFLLYTDLFLKELLINFKGVNTHDVGNDRPIPLAHLTGEVMRQTNTARHLILDLDELEEVERLYRSKRPEGTSLPGWLYFLSLLDYVRGLERNTQGIIRVVIWVEE